MTLEVLLLQTYYRVHAVLDNREPMSLATAESLSRVSDALAEAYAELTGRTVGEALGWDKKA